MNIFITILSVVLITILPSALLFLWARKKGWATLRLMAVCVMFPQIVLGLIVWLGIKESWIIFIVAILAILNGLSILTLPFTAPKLFKNMKIKW
jgi:hypothetical protein